jgi:ABC-type nitrate/sulfonate/bicarbonate transport system permease component
MSVMQRLARPLWLAASCVMLALIVMGWQAIADHHLVSRVFLPGPDKAWAALLDGFRRGDIGLELVSTIERMIYGWLLASVLGVVLGTLIGSSRQARAFFGPTLEFLRPLPASAVIPVAIAMFGLSGTMVLGVIGFGTLWPMLLATVHGFAAVEPRLIEVSRALRLSRLEIIWKIALPNALPDILAGMRLGLTIALILSVVGEMLAGQEGLGLRILLAARSFHAPDLFAGVILLGLVGFVSNALLGVAERYLLSWRQP